MFSNSINVISCGHQEGGLTTRSKNFKIQFFLQDTQNSSTWNWSETSQMFLLEISEQIWFLKAVKVFVEMSWFVSN